VRLISKSATTSNNVIYYKVYVDVANSQGKLFPTMTARTNIVVTQVENALMVPNNCIFHDGKRTYVKKYDDATQQSTQVDVTVGLEGNDKTQITSSELRQGDKVEVRVVKATQTNNQRGGPPM
jgi:HlyD family secretion protein